MNPSNPNPIEAQPSAAPAVAPRIPDDARRFLPRFFILAALLSMVFAIPLWQWIQLALRVDLQSHTLLIPFVTLYLLRTAGKNRLGHGTVLPPADSPMTGSVPGISCRAPNMAAWSCGLAGVASLAAWLAFRRSGVLAPSDALALAILAYVLFLASMAFLVFGWPRMRGQVFALGFLLFMIPLPVPITDGISMILQRASAEASDFTLRLTGMPVLRDDLSFQLPGLRIFVAEECSGIRSTLVLFITSVLGSYLFLQRGWARVVFVLAVFPIGVFRNALRITTISWLTVNVDPGVIDSPLHHRGGPIFFVISLIPLFCLLWWLRRIERRSSRKP